MLTVIRLLKDFQTPGGEEAIKAGAVAIRDRSLDCVRFVPGDIVGLPKGALPHYDDDILNDLAYETLFHISPATQEMVIHSP
jgi:hypothetical protein